MTNGIGRAMGASTIEHPHPAARRRRVAVALGLLAGGQAALAQQAPPPDTELQQIIVTGEKTPRPLDRTAASISVIDARTLAEQPASTSLRDLFQGAVNFVASGTQNLAPAVRGIDGTGPAQGADAFLAGTRPRLSVQIDGRPASYNEVTFGDLGLWDVEQIELFRGAHSTLQGRNAIAGTVIVKTQDPVFVPEFGARAVAAGQHTRQLSAVVSGPVIDEQMAFRLAADRQTHDSFVGGYTPYEGVADPGAFETTSVRAKLLLKPQALAGFKTLVTLAHTDHSGPQTECVVRPFDERRTCYAAMNTFNPRVTSGVVDTTWDLSSRLAFENRLSYGDVFIGRTGEPGDGNVEIHGHDLMIEPRLRYASADGTASGFVGLYHFLAKQHEEIDLFGGGAWNDDTRTSAVYGEGTWAVRSDLDLTLGGRYEEERRLRVGALSIFPIDFDKTYKTFLPKAALSWHADDLTTLGVAVARGYNGGSAAFTYAAPFVHYEFDPEYVTTVEAFARSRLLDGKLRLTGNVFHSSYKDFQLPFDLNSDPSIWAYVVRNAPRARTWGAEFGATWIALPGLRLNGELGLLKTKVTRYPDSGVEGHELARSPKLSLAAGADYRHASGFGIGAQARYSSGYFSDITNVDRGRVEPGWIVNARADYKFSDVRVFAYVANLFDNGRPLFVDAQPAGDPAQDTAQLPRPRTAGVGVEVWF